MVRPRNVLLASFPPNVITPEQASEALRKADGDIEEAKKHIQVELLSAKTDEKAAKPAAATLQIAKPATKHSSPAPRIPPATSVVVNNLSDRQYCCVWGVEVFQDGYRPEVARALLAQVARHVNPVLRERGWRVKRLMESASKSWIGCCTGNGRDDADAASVNIQLNLRVQPNRRCTVFRSFSQILSVMLHEITHTSIGLEDIHPPAFYELLREIRKEYQSKLKNGEVDLETDDYGCSKSFISAGGEVGTIQEAASEELIELGAVESDENEAADQCGASKRRRRRGRQRGVGKKRSSSGMAMGTVALQKQQKRRPLLKGARMIDKRTKDGKAAMVARETMSASELAANAALERFGGNSKMVTASKQEIASKEEIDSSSEDESDNDIVAHAGGCACRSCDWDKMLFVPKNNEE